MLTNKASVMLFMKGNKQEAKCGFSKQILEILNSTGVEYETFDILEDEEVRQGLKTFSNWPTYPQLYVRGDLVGGLDIVKVRAFHCCSQELTYLLCLSIQLGWCGAPPLQPVSVGARLMLPPAQLPGRGKRSS